MSTTVALNHRTTYRYDRRVRLGPQIVRLKPAAHARTRIISYGLKVEPRNHFINWIQDPHGNFLARLVFPEKLERVGRAVDSRLEAPGYELTIGGEPIFVSDSDRTAPEWNGEALGPTKKEAFGRGSYTGGAAGASSPCTLAPIFAYS